MSKKRDHGVGETATAAAEEHGATPVYTKTGDAGTTGMLSGPRVSKADPRLEAYGTVDELNAVVGRVRALTEQGSDETPALGQLVAQLGGVQQQLFVVASSLARGDGPDRPAVDAITPDAIAALEAEMDRCSAELPPLRSFILPGGCLLNAELHVARTVCRRAERWCVAMAEHHEVEPTVLRYVNRLSDVFFVWARWVSVQLGAEETTRALPSEGRPTE